MMAGLYALLLFFYVVGLPWRRRPPFFFFFYISVRSAGAYFSSLSFILFFPVFFFFLPPSRHFDGVSPLLQCREARSSLSRVSPFSMSFIKRTSPVSPLPFPLSDARRQRRSFPPFSPTLHYGEAIAGVILPILLSPSFQEHHEGLVPPPFSKYSTTCLSPLESLFWLTSPFLKLMMTSFSLSFFFFVRE